MLLLYYLLHIFWGWLQATTVESKSGWRSVAVGLQVRLMCKGNVASDICAYVRMCASGHNIVWLYVGCGTVAFELNFYCLEKYRILTGGKKSYTLTQQQQHTHALVIRFSKRKLHKTKPLCHELECFRFQKLIKWLDLLPPLMKANLENLPKIAPVNKIA